MKSIFSWMKQRKQILEDYSTEIKGRVNLNKEKKSKSNLLFKVDWHIWDMNIKNSKT